MRCGRCDGLMVEEKATDENEKTDLYRCPHCGEIVDSVIIENRILSRNPEELEKLYFKKSKRGRGIRPRIVNTNRAKTKNTKEC